MAALTVNYPNGACKIYKDFLKKQLDSLKHRKMDVEIFEGDFIKKLFTCE